MLKYAASQKALPTIQQNANAMPSPVIVALDFKAMAFVNALGDAANSYKFGLQLLSFCAFKPIITLLARRLMKRCKVPISIR